VRRAKLAWALGFSPHGVCNWFLARP
jgi:hypothetical protein